MKRLVVGALAALVLALVTLTVVQRVRDARDEPVMTPISADAHYALDGPLTCDSDLHDVPQLPLDAKPVAMLVCADPTPTGAVQWTSPGDLVEGDLGPLVEVLDDLEETPDEPYDCTFQGGPSYDLLLRFSRGRYARIHGDTGGCGVVSVATGDWFGADEVLDAALGLVEEQRERLPVPTSLPDPPECPVDTEPPAYSLTGEVADLVVAVSCWRPDSRRPRPFEGPVPVPQRQLRALLTDVDQNSEPLEMPGDYDCPGGLDELYSQVLQGRTAWGDLVPLSGMCREFYVDFWSRRPADEPPGVWHPSPASERILDGLRR